MKKIQCTFRLPENIVEMIDNQEGDTRTDKLLLLIGANNLDVRQSVINHDYRLTEKVDLLEKRVEQLEGKRHNVTKLVSNESPNMNTHEQMIVSCIKSYKSQEGLSAKDIASKLNELGYLTVSLKEFTKGSVEGIIRRKL